MQSQFQSQMQSQGLALPLELEVGPSAACVSTKESCVDPSGNDPDTGDSDKCRLYIEENPPCLVSLGRLYEESTTVHKIPLLHDQVKVGVEEVRDADAFILVPTEEVKLVGQTLNTFLAWLTHLLKHLSEQSIQRFGQSQFESESYIKNWMQNSKWDVYLEAYLNGAHWQMVVILPKENVVIWFCSLHNRLDNYLKGIINNALKGLDDTPQSKSKAAAR
ncbi:hypothetical protein HKD37_19G053644 [Glycine soja]